MSVYVFDFTFKIDGVFPSNRVLYVLYESAYVVCGGVSAVYDKACVLFGNFSPQFSISSPA